MWHHNAIQRSLYGNASDVTEPLLINMASYGVQCIGEKSERLNLSGLFVLLVYIFVSLAPP